MARRRFAPKHTLTGPALFVPQSDGAWIESEIPDPDSEKNPEWMDHAFWQYITGKTRFNLDDPDLQACIDRDSAEVWEIEPLGLRHRKKVMWMQRRDEHEEVSEFAFLRGVVTVTGATGETGEALRQALEEKPRDHAKVLAAVEAYSMDAVEEVGNAVTRLSQDLTPQEKKHSASPPGGGSQSQGT